MKPYRLALTLGLLLATASNAVAEEAAKESAPTRAIEVAGGSLTFDAPESWELVTPKSRILEKELAITPPEGVEARPARLTMMAAGGSPQANLARWIGQFQGAGPEAAGTERVTVDSLPTTLLDISGTYLESAGGPFGPKTPRDDYRMLAAIVETGDSVSYFFKLIGPAATVDPAADAFRAMIDSLRKTR